MIDEIRNLNQTFNVCHGSHLDSCSLCYSVTVVCVFYQSRRHTISSKSDAFSDYLF